MNATSTTSVASSIIADIERLYPRNFEIYTHTSTFSTMEDEDEGFRWEGETEIIGELQWLLKGYGKHDEFDMLDNILYEITELSEEQDGYAYGRQMRRKGIDMKDGYAAFIQKTAKAIAASGLAKKRDALIQDLYETLGDSSPLLIEYLQLRHRRYIATSLNNFHYYFGYAGKK